MAPELTSVARARELVLEACAPPLPAEEVALERALGRVLAEDVATPATCRRSPARPWTASPCWPARRSGALRVVGESRAGHPADGARRRGRRDPDQHRRDRARGRRPRWCARRTPRSATARSCCHAAARPGDNIRERRRGHGGRDARAGRRDAARRRRARRRRRRRPRGVALRDAARASRCSPRATSSCRPARPLQPGQLHDSNALTLAALAELARSVGRRAARRAPTARRRRAAALDDALVERRRRRRLRRRLRRPARPRQAGAGRARRRASASGASRCSRASRRGSARASGRSCSGCPATRSRRWSPSCSSPAPRCARCRALAALPAREPARLAQRRQAQPGASAGAAGRPRPARRRAVGDAHRTAAVAHPHLDARTPTRWPSSRPARASSPRARRVEIERTLLKRLLVAILAMRR